MTITAIETRYAGCRFRSRLEARWAVFFDALGIRWEYEPQGFLVNTPERARPYLPDFLLPDCGTWIEVKGSADAIDKELLLHAAGQLPPKQGRLTTRRLLILGPIPEPSSRDGGWNGDWGWRALHYWDECSFGPDCTQEPSNDHEQPWPPEGCSECGRRKLWQECTGFGKFRATGSLAPRSGNLGKDWTVPAPCPYERGCPEAYRAARSARFEHGEAGR